MLLHQRVFAMKRDRVKVQVERRTVLQAQAVHGVKPMPHEPRITGRGDAATVLREKRTLGNDVQPGEQCQPFVEHRAHHVRMPLGAEEFQGQQAPHRVGRGNHPRAWQITLADDAIKTHFHQRRKEEKQATELGAKGSRLQTQGPRIGRVGGGGLGAAWTLVVPTPRQPGEPLLLKHRGHGCGAAANTFLLEGLADIMDGLVLLAELNDLLLYRFARLGSWTRRFGEELPGGVLAELVCQLVQAADGVAESRGDICGRNPVDEIGPQGFVLPMRGVLRSQKDLSQIH